MKKLFLFIITAFCVLTLGAQTGEWLLQGNFKASDWSGPTKMEAKTDGAENTLYATLTLEPGKEYEFKINRDSEWYGNGGTMTRAHCTNWTMSTADGNCRIATTIKGDYEFAFNTSSKTLSVVYPYNPKQATLYETAVPDRNPDVMLQAFYWAHDGNTAIPYTEYGDVSWRSSAKRHPNWQHISTSFGSLPPERQPTSLVICP